MADQFKYIINATLKLNAGSLTKLVNDIKTMDRDIKAEFEKQGTAIKVPLTADQDIQRLRTGVNRIVEGYNKGQAPSIKIPVIADEQSISKLQARIAEVRKQLNSLSDEKARVSVNTSLVVGRNEGEEVQKQVEGIKPTIEVKVIANEDSLKQMKAQIEAIKAEVQATVNAVQNVPENMRRIGAHRNQSNTSSVGRTSTNRKINISRSQADKFIADRKAITDEINAIQNNIKLLEKEEKLSLSASEIEKRINSIQQAQSKGRTKWQPRDEKGIVIKGTKTVKSENFENEINYYKSMLEQADEINKLKKQLSDKLKTRDTLERTIAYKNPSKNKPTPRSHISADSALGQTLADIDAKKKEEKARQDALDKASKQRQAEADKSEKKRQEDEAKAEKKRQSDAEKARIKVQRDNERALKRTQQVSYNRLNRGRSSAETYDRKLGYIQNLEDMPNRYVDLNQQKSNLVARVNQLKDLTGGNSNGMTGAQKRAQYSPQALTHVQSMIDRLNSDIKSLDDEINVERVKLQEHVGKLYGTDTQGRKLQQSLLGGSGKVNPNDVVKANIKAQTLANVKSENDAKIKAWEEQKAQEELEKQWSQTGAYSELPSNGRIAKLMARNQARQDYLNRKTQSVAQAKNDYDTHTRRYGGNREYSGTDLEAMLKDPNVNLQDSLSILKNRINPYNAQQAYQNKQSFQKAYTIGYKDDEGNIRNIRTLTYEYTKLGETIERGDKGFTSMLSHIGTKVGVFSLLEGAMFGVIGAVSKGIEDMAQFDAQLAEVVATTKDLNAQGNQLQSFYSQGQNGISGTSSMESQVQNDTFKNAETYGVSALNTVMPIEQQVIARHNLVSGNGGYDANMKNQIVQKIMQFSAISTGGEATPEETNDLTKDALSLYQAYYNPDNPTQHIDKMNSLFDNLTSMRMNGVNTTAVTDAMAELAPDTLTSGIDSNQVISMMGAYNLSDASATGEDIQTIGRTFFGSLRHANTNENLKNALQQYMGIDLNSQAMPANELLKKMLDIFPTLNDAQQEQFAQAFAGTSGKGTAMTPKMVKFLQATQGSDYKNFMANDANGNNSGAMEKSWLPFSDRLKTNFDNLVEKLQEFTQLIGRLGVLDGLNTIVGAFSKILDVVNAVLRATQNVSDFFNNHNIWNIPQHTIELVSFMTTLKALTALMNKAKFGGAIGDLLAMTPITSRLGVKTTAQRIGLGESAVGETLGTLGPMININRNTSDDATKVTRTVAQDTEKVATKSAESATKSAVNVMKTSALKNSADSMLKDVLTFTTADVLANKLKRNPAMNVIEESVMTPKTVTSRAFDRTVLDSAITTTAKRDAMSTGGKVLNSVGSFMSDMLFLSAMKGKGAVAVAEDGVAVASKAGPLAKFGEILLSMLPALRNFGLLLGRLSIVGAVATGAYMAYDAYQKHNAQVYKQQTVNAKGNFAKLAKDSSFKHATIGDVNQWLKLNAEPLGQGHDMLATKQLNDKMAHDWNLNYKGQGKNATISYVDAKGETKTARVDNKDGSLTQFKEVYSNNGLTDVQKLSDAWKVNTDSMTDYANELTMIDVLSKNIAVTMNSIATGQKQIDATFGGISSSDSLQQKIDLAKKGLSDSKDQGTKLQAHSTDINLEYQRSTDAYNKQVNKALGTNLISQSDIENAITKLEVAKASGKTDINTVIDSYQGLDATDSKDLKKIQSLGFANKKGKITDQQGLDEYNTKQEALKSVLATYQQYSASNDLNAQSQDALNSFIDQQSQYKESIKQMTAQLMVAKLGLDAMNASLQQLGAVASASKTLVDMNENVLNTGNNNVQIGALHSSMQVSSAQMENMLSQQGTMQNAMDKIKSANPNQDFSLNSLYNPQGQVTPEQMAYKSLYEQSNQMTQNISNQSSAMYQQVQQLRDLVLNSNEYADSWQRIQQTVQDVKDSIKSANDFQYQMATLNENSLMTAGTTGQKVTDVRQQQLQAMRDNSLQITTKLTTDKASFNSDISKLNNAWAQIMSEEGQNFNDNMVKPLNNIVGSFGNAVSDFGKDVSANNTNMKNAISQMNQAVSQAQQSSLNSASQSSTGSFGGVSNTGQTIQTGQFAEKNYDAEMSPYARGMYSGQVGAFVQAGAKYGVPPELLLAIAMSENSGSSNILNHSYNVGNIKATGSSPEWGGGSYEGYRAYDSLQQGINDLAHLISEKISSGYNTIPLINKHYAEDPNWMNNVASFMGKMTGTSASTWLGDATINSGFNIGGSASSSSSGGGGGGGGSYTVQSGDTLSGIGQKFGVDYHSIASANGISNPNRISVGQVLTIPGAGGGGGGSAPSSAGGGNGGVNGMFGWFNSVLNNTSAMQYQWGGAHVVEDWNSFISKAAADCSGLVEQVYKQFAGINLGTTTAQGIYSDNNGGTPVDRSQLQAGDLVFFGGSTGSISHVGVYAGNNQMYTIDHDGMPVTKENLWSDYVAGKHFNISSGSSSSSSSNPLTASVSAPDPLQAYKDSQDAAVAYTQGIIPQMVQKMNDDMIQANWNGNVADVMGTSGRTSSYDKLAQARQDIGAQLISNRDQIDALNARHDMYVDQLNSAYSRGDVGGYTTARDYMATTDKLIYALQQNSSQLQSLDATYKAQQQLDPRLNTSTAHDYIVGGLNQLQSYDANGQGMSVDYMRVVNEVNTMKSQYMDHQKQAQSLGTLFDNYGSESTAYGMAKSISDQDSINLLYTQINNINGVLKGFAEGTQQWYSVLNASAQVEQKLHDLEQQRLNDAKTMFTLTGQGLQSYIQQRAYTQSKDYSQNASNLQDAIYQYKNGATPAQNGYGIQMPSWDNSDNGRGAAQSVSNYLSSKFGYQTSVVNAEGGYTVRGDANLSKDQANKIFSDLYGTKIGAGWVTDGGYGIQMPSWYGSASSGNASTVQKYIKDTWGYNMQMKAVNDQNGSGYTLVGQDNLTQQNASDIFNDLFGKYIGAGWVKTPNMYDTSKSYGLSTQNFSDKNGQDAQNAQHYMGLWTGSQPNWVQDKQGGGHWQASNLTNSQANNLDGLLKEFGYSSGNTVTTSMDFNSQLANLQTIADTHNAMTQQMNDYKQAVTDAFKAGAMSIDEYISKLNQLRDVQTEQKESAVNMVGNIQSGFSSALSDALTQGMQGSINSPLDFMNSIKSTLSSSISGQLTNTLLNNTGLQDVMNKISSSVASASTSGDPNAIVNMFNNNDFGKQMQDAIAPFLPMIQQIVGSTKGIFTILKDQVYNAPSGFKVNNYMNEIASSVGYEGIKTMNPNVNSVGSPLLNFGSSGQIQTTSPSQTPTGVPTTTSGTGATTTGAPENTTGSSQGAPDATSSTNAPAISGKAWQSNAPTPPPPPAPAPSSTSTYTVVSGDTLSGIGAKLGVSWTSIASLNGIGSPYTIYPGEVLRISGGSGGGGGGGSSSGTKHTSSALYFHSSPSYGNNVMGTIPQGAGVTYYGLVSGWAKVGYNGQTGYVGPRYLYHTGGIAGVTNFASGKGLKPNELSAILQKSETIFQPKQLDDLVNGAMQAGASSSSSNGGVNINVTVNFSGDTSDKGVIEQTVNTAVQKALQEFKKTTRLNNLSWKGTSY